MSTKFASTAWSFVCQLCCFSSLNSVKPSDLISDLSPPTNCNK